ncbi:MAG TPA: carboxylating nicotinate-nucleotide diphosphorylase [Vicinamibacteria bacterium]|nr:carboxylating nicotinate-nucleotide diphosphorylase [Vicinamibacteria bacterium]
MIAPLHRLQYEALVRAALREDLGRAGDLTTDAIVPPERPAEGMILVRREGRIAGLDVALAAFRELDPEARFRVLAGDGDDVSGGEIVAYVRTSARALLSAERVALNLLGRLSGIATVTRDVVRRVEGTGAAIVCTRKTTPGLRALEKYAVRVGGGRNHRFGLDDAVLIKDNHRALAGGVAAAVARVRERVGHMVKIEVEVDSLDQLREALELGVEVVLLDNMTPPVLREAVALARGRARTEASGGITAETVRAVAETGVDMISLGFLTHSAPSLDVSLEIEAAPAP